MPSIRGRTVTANFTDAGNHVITKPLYAINYGQELIIEGLTLPEMFEVHFSKDGNPAKEALGTVVDGVASVKFYDEHLKTAGLITAYIFLHEGLEDGETEFIIQTFVKDRPDVDPTEPTPVEQSVITQLITAMRETLELAEQYRDETEAFKDAAIEEINSRFITSDEIEEVLEG